MSHTKKRENTLSITFNRNSLYIFPKSQEIENSEDLLSKDRAFRKRKYSLLLLTNSKELVWNISSVVGKKYNKLKEWSVLNKYQICWKHHWISAIYRMIFASFPQGCSPWDCRMLAKMHAHVCIPVLFGRVRMFKPNYPVPHSPHPSRSPLDAKGNLGSLRDNKGLMQLLVPMKPGFKSWLLVLSGYIILGKILKFPTPQFPHLQNGNV